MMILYVEGRIFSWGKSSRGRLGREASSDDSRCPSLVSVAAAARDDDDDVLREYPDAGSDLLSYPYRR